MPSEFQRNLKDSLSDFSSSRGIWRRLRIDSVLLVLLSSIAIFGLVVLYSASGGDETRVFRQAVYLGVAFFVMFAVAQFPVKTIQALAPIAYFIGVILLGLVLAYGVEVNGSRRWLDVFGLIRFQPSELMKIAVPLTVAAYLARVPAPADLRQLLTAAVIAVVPFLLIAKQPDLGTSLLIGASGVVVIWLAGLRWSVILICLLGIAAAAWPIWNFLLQGYQKQRVLTLLDPESDKLGAGWNIIQSTTAIGSGGWSGKGWMQGTQSQLEFLPESHTDFIIAVLAEEYGLFGVTALLTLYMLVVIRASIVALQAKNAYAMLVAGGLTFTFFFYVLVNMGMVSGILPIVGVPLPFVSYGGTALISMAASFGLLMAINSESRD